MLYWQKCPECGHISTPDCYGHTCHECGKADYVEHIEYISNAKGGQTVFPGNLTIKGIETNEYSWFREDEYNRPLDNEALLELKDDFNQDVKDGDYPFQAPIVVYWVKGMTEGIIQQGHHRFAVCKDENRVVRYIVTDVYRPSSRGQENQHQDWSTEELISSYAREGIEPYVVLQKLKNEHPSYSLVVLTTFLNNYPVSTKYLRDRLFKLSITDTEEAYGKAKQRILRFEEFNKSADRTDKPKETVRALIVAMERTDFDWNYFLERAKVNAREIRLRPEFKSISTSARATGLIQFLYNHNSRKNFFF